MFKTVLSFKQTDMIKHAYGYYTKKPGFRTHYCTSLDDKNMLDMVKNGYFKKPIGIGLVGENHGIFHLTEKGINFLKDARIEENKIKASLAGD